ncbi:MAG: RHS repeat-associated core domain-containing protein [Ahniella sp.]|nr:RHS repeat-associated core domain-containing protein [Ahniella sp.]
MHSGNQSQDPNETGQAALLSNDQQAIGFTGYQKDEALGLYYANARFYDPLVGAFGATDPWAGDPSRPVTLNKFLYANGNPVVFVDPSGKYGEAGHFYDFHSCSGCWTMTRRTPKLWHSIRSCLMKLANLTRSIRLYEAAFDKWRD